LRIVRRVLRIVREDSRTIEKRACATERHLADMQRQTLNYAFFNKKPTEV